MEERELASYEARIEELLVAAHEQFQEDPELYM